MRGATNVFAGFCCKKYKICDYATLILQQNKKKRLRGKSPFFGKCFLCVLLKKVCSPVFSKGFLQVISSI